MIILRILAQLVDLLVACFLLIFSFLVIRPALFSWIPGLSGTVAAVLILVIFIFLAAAIQYPFLQVGQTVGKAFFGLEIVSTNPSRPLTISILVQREIFGKLLSCYLLCIPVLYGAEAGHDKAAETVVVYKNRRRKKNTP